MDKRQKSKELQEQVCTRLDERKTGMMTMARKNMAMWPWTMQNFCHEFEL